MSALKKIAAILFLCLATQLQAQEWYTDFAQAKKLATEESKNIILVFSGSDWCAPCIKLEKQIWESTDFKAEASKNWVLVKADFPKKKANALPEPQQQQNATLYEKYNAEGAFPLVVVLDKNGKVLGKTAYKNISPTEYISHLHSFEKK